jgi:hypothetical protein
VRAAKSDQRLVAAHRHFDERALAIVGGGLSGASSSFLDHFQMAITLCRLTRFAARPITKRGQGWAWRAIVGVVIEQRPPLLLRLKLLLRDVHAAVWRCVTLADSLSIADLHKVIQLLMGWDDDHLHRFRIHGRDFGIAYVGGPGFDEDAAAVPLTRFWFRPIERFLYEYDFTAGWQVEMRVEEVAEEALCQSHRIPVCVAGRERGPPDGFGGPRAHAEQRRDAVSWDMATDMDASSAVSPMAMTLYWPIPRRSRTSKRPCPAYGHGNPFWPRSSRAPRSTPHCGRRSPQGGVPDNPDGDTGRLH